MVYGNSKKGYFGLSIKELIYDDMKEVLGYIPSGHYYYTSVKPKFLDEEKKEYLFGIYETEKYVVCSDRFNSIRTVLKENLKLVDIMGV